MQNQPLEVVVVSSQEGLPQKSPAPSSDEGLHLYKRLRSDSPFSSKEWEEYPSPNRTRLVVSVTSAEESAHHLLETERIQPETETLKLRPQEDPSPQFVPSLTQSQSTILCKKKAGQRQCKASYNPDDFTSDELDPLYEWPKKSSSVDKRDLDVISLLRSILVLFPLGLRLEKLEMMLWKEHEVKLCKISMEYGYRDSLRFLQAMPWIRTKLSSKGTSRWLVQWDPATSC
ncbi:uncharacterized protein LOC100556011 [Anolis carolinensis]|uniref:uncharacterized protein LOC100556011 n=1 Tax=Anolis carolinensis TaxID=28377 RepID=UPI000203A405|nr:PREDICTED: uncharacterized protein LOC100556011 [Anolis carolinensis]XP_008115427.1 PREDICTED: uncharacterized protein LOC100556011 [Anolis carolinensis]|eukprot:XP_003225078.1 PREDICTED: uncharacterized protein LOC100556011 [Anolis carolinensis]